MDSIEYTHVAGLSLPAHHGDPNSEYGALRDGAALVDLSHRPLFRLSGKDPAALLATVATNDIPDTEDLGAYALLLGSKGHVRTDLRAVKNGEEILIDIETEGEQALQEILGRYAPFYRLKLEELSQWSVLGLYGPRAGELLGVNLREHQSREIDVGGANLLAAGVALPAGGLDLIGPTEAVRAAWDHLLPLGATPTGIHALETARIESGLPRFGSDFTPENFPAEANLLDRAVSLRKGCYPGQETVAKMYYRGRPNRTLYRFTLGDAPPEEGAEILQNGERVGNLTSVAPLRIDGKIPALGYLSRKADPESPVQADGSPLSPVC